MRPNTPRNELIEILRVNREYVDHRSYINDVSRSHSLRPLLMQPLSVR